MAKIGQTIKFTDGTIGTITNLSMGDFIGDPRMATVQYIEDGAVKHTYISERTLEKTT